MLVNMNFYEGVPVGPSDFSEFFRSVKKNVDSLLIYTLSSSFAQNNLSANGGYVIGGELEIAEMSGFYVLRSRNINKKGILFAKDPSNGRYFVEEYPYFTEIKDMPVVAWEILASGNDKSLLGNDKTRVELVYPNKILPKYPIMWEKDINGNYIIQSRKYYSVRYNGVPQGAYDLKQDSLVFTKLQLGAEYPWPVDAKGTFVDTTVPRTFYEWTQVLGQNGVIYLRFPNSNFSIDTPILLMRERSVDSSGTLVYSYHALREDKSFDNEVATNSFKVIDKAKGIVKIKITEQFVKYVLKSNKNSPAFDFIVPEQLVSVINNGIVEYKTRFGSIYNGDTSQVELLSLNFKGNELILNRIIDDLSNTPGTDTIYVDRAKTVGDILLAVKYDAVPRVETTAQRNKFFPDIITLFYSTGVPASSVAGASRVRAIVENNKASWYNQNVAIAEYRPVNRMDKSFVTLVGADWLSTPDLINPIQPLTISNSALPAYTYGYKDKVTLGTVDKYVRADAKVPEPHYVNPTIVKMTLPQDELLIIYEDQQMSVHRRYKIDGRIIVDGLLIIE